MSVSDATTAAVTDGEREENGERVDPRTARTRAAILDAGARRLMELGPDAITPASVATAASVSRTTLYKHFPTRRDLLGAILDHIQPHAQLEVSGDVRADLRSLLAGVAEGMHDAEMRKLFSSLVSHAQWDQETREIKESIRAIELSNLSAILAAAADAGDLPSGIDPEWAAARLVGPLVFRAFFINDGTSPDEVEHIIDDFIAIANR